MKFEIYSDKHIVNYSGAFPRPLKRSKFSSATNKEEKILNSGGKDIFTYAIGTLLKLKALSEYHQKHFSGKIINLQDYILWSQKKYEIQELLIEVYNTYFRREVQKKMDANKENGQQYPNVNYFSLDDLVKIYNNDEQHRIGLIVYSTANDILNEVVIRKERKSKGPVKSRPRI